MFKYIAALLALVVIVGVILAVANRRFLVGFWMYGGQAREGELELGDAAPDVRLVELDGSTERQLAEWFGSQPVVLVFGSFT